MDSIERPCPECRWTGGHQYGCTLVVPLIACVGEFALRDRISVDLDCAPNDRRVAVIRSNQDQRILMGRRAEQLVWIDMGATSRQAALLSARGHRRIGIEEARAMLTATPLTMLMRRSWRSFRGEWRGARVEVPLMVTASPRPSPSGITSDARQSVMSVRRESGTIDGRPAIRLIGTVDATSVVLEENCS